MGRGFIGGNSKNIHVSVPSGPITVKIRSG
jgi:hypothetical protein